MNNTILADRGGARAHGGPHAADRVLVQLDRVGGEISYERLRLGQPKALLRLQFSFCLSFFSKNAVRATAR